MLRVVCVVDKENTAIDRLAQGVKPYHTNLDYHVVAVHPKRPDQKQLETFEQLARTADIIDYQYFRTAEMLRGRYEWLKQIPSILTHNNPYSIHESNWNDYDIVVANNKNIYADLQKITDTRLEYISLAVDPYFWTYNTEYKYPFSVIMVANRIESKKGILPVAKACKQLNCKMYLVGNISDMDYFNQVMAVGNVEYAQNVSDEELRDLYYKSGIHVCNSIDNFESGTLPILEAIYCGVPVLTRKIGHVPDFMTGSNIAILETDSEDIENIAQKLSEMFGDKKRLDTMRNEAWMSIKDKNFDRRAYNYQLLYRSLIPGKTVSVIVPVCDKPEITVKTLNAIANQTHENIEIVIVDDGKSQEKEIQDFAKTTSLPVRYVYLGGSSGYNLAKARNLGAILSTGDILVFCDQRMLIDKNAVKEFVSNIKPRYWLYGSKGVKKEFVENFSAVLKSEFVSCGMFNERCDQYGAMSQEIRSRIRRQDIQTEYVESAKATPIGKSNNKHTKKIEIMESKNWLWKVGLQ